jgi:hypothetical protein
VTLPIPDEWVFFHDLVRDWRWEQRRGGQVLQESSRGFTNRDECLADAERNGFLAGPANAESDFAPQWLTRPGVSR